MRSLRPQLPALFLLAALAASPVLPAEPAAAVPAGIPAPSEFLGFEVGADRTLADYRQIGAYLRALAAASDRVDLESLGESTRGEEILLAVISSPENLANRSRLQEIARRLADPRGLAPEEEAVLLDEGRVFLLVTCNIHATEIAASQMAMEWAHALATASDERTGRWLDDVVLLLAPSINPDGQIMETEWYRARLGTPQEGGRMPWLYHPYVGHDNNRDWFMLTQKETRAVSRAVYREWLPQVWLDQHQMGSTGPRMFVPPFAEPASPAIHPLVWRDVNLIGANMAFRLEQAGKSGVIYGYAFDAYWPGGTKNTAWWKNISGLLTEVASARLASPVRIEPSELAGGGKGLVEYGPQTNFPNPWPGGAWRLRDIMDYERIASDAILETCSERRRDLLANALARARAAIASFAPDEAWRLPAVQRDPAAAAALAALLDEHGVELRASAEGDVYVPLAQPYGRFVEEMLSVQRFPEVKLVPGREIVRPYDVAAWTLPLMMGVAAERAALPPDLPRWRPVPPQWPADAPAVALLPGRAAHAAVVNAALAAGGEVRLARRPLTAGGVEWPAGTWFLDAAGAQAGLGAATPGVVATPLSGMPGETEALRAPRVGIYKPWLASMDEGWTRFVLERAGFAPRTLDNQTVQKGNLRASFDVLVLPDIPKETIATGRPKREEGAVRYFADLPPEFAGGLGKEGAAALVEFARAGGTLVALASAGEYLLGEMELPVRNALAPADDFACPGSLLRGQVAPGHPVTWGLPEEVALFVDVPLAFATLPPGPDLERWVLATYPTAPADVLLSGWIRGEEQIARRAAAVATTYGKGKVVLLAFRPQHRAQTHATYPFLFNALYWSVLER